MGASLSCPPHAPARHTPHASCAPAARQLGWSGSLPPAHSLLHPGHAPAGGAAPAAHAARRRPTAACPSASAPGPGTPRRCQAPSTRPPAPCPPALARDGVFPVSAAAGEVQKKARRPPPPHLWVVHQVALELVLEVLARLVHRHLGQHVTVVVGRALVRQDVRHAQQRPAGQPALRGSASASKRAPRAHGAWPESAATRWFQMKRHAEASPWAQPSPGCAPPPGRPAPRARPPSACPRAARTAPFQSRAPPAWRAAQTPARGARAGPRQHVTKPAHAPLGMCASRARTSYGCVALMRASMSGQGITSPCRLRAYRASHAASPANASRNYAVPRTRRSKCKCVSIDVRFAPGALPARSSGSGRAPWTGSRRRPPRWAPSPG